VVVTLGRWSFIGVFCASCASSAPVHVASDGFLGTDDATHELVPRGADRYTVLIFFSSDCHVLKAHDERIRQVATEYEGRGVRFFAVDSEVGATLRRDQAEAELRRYPFPILLDEGARIARAFDAAYAGHVVVLDRAGHVAYQGGIDSDLVHLTDARVPYLNRALAELLAGQSPRIVRAKTLGCALRTW
jgi:thiol-disulfide isomerase/thioredoxin